MLSLRVDESKDDASGMCIVAGFLGNKLQWKEYVKAWVAGRGSRSSLHLKELHLGSKLAPRRWGAYLANLGAIPHQCGLRPFAGSICTSDYADKVAGTVLEVLMEGYVLAILALMDEVGSHISKGERVQVLFEENQTYAAVRERAMIYWRKTHKTPAGWSVLSGWGSRPKGTLTEASDYLCYALQQSCLDPESQKARLTAPILNPFPQINHTSQATVDSWLKKIASSRVTPIPRLTKELKREIRR